MTRPDRTHDLPLTGRTHFHWDTTAARCQSSCITQCFIKKFLFHNIIHRVVYAEDNDNLSKRLVFIFNKYMFLPFAFENVLFGEVLSFYCTCHHVDRNVNFFYHAVWIRQTHNLRMCQFVWKPVFLFVCPSARLLDRPSVYTTCINKYIYEQEARLFLKDLSIRFFTPKDKHTYLYFCKIKHINLVMFAFIPSNVNDIRNT